MSIHPYVNSFLADSINIQILKAMNEARFILFFIYNVDFYNMNLQKLLRSVVNPFSPHRLEFIKNVEIKKPVEENTNDKNLSSGNIEQLSEDLSVLIINKTCLDCELCGASFKKKGFLSAHMKKKHGANNIVEPVSETQKENDKEKTHDCLTCGKVFVKKWKLNKHIKCHD